MGVSSCTVCWSVPAERRAQLATDSAIPMASAPAAMAASAFVFFSISKSPYPVYLRAQVKYETPVAFLHTSPVRGSCMYSSPPT